jgi:hypothetical protein
MALWQVLPHHCSVHSNWWRVKAGRHVLTFACRVWAQRQAAMAGRVLMCAGAFAIAVSLESVATIHCPAGGAIEPDGTIGAGEWSDAASTSISVRRDWTVRVHYKHDRSHLYLLFDQLTHGEERLFPEVFIDPANARGRRWQPAQWWLHVSHNLCEGAGQPNLYRRDGVFLCSHQKEGWNANNPPARDSHVVEILIDYGKLGITANTTRIGLAFAVTNATGDSRQKWFFWPAMANVDRPSSWGQAALE